MLATTLLPRYASEKAARNSYYLLYRSFTGLGGVQLDGFPDTSQIFTMSDKTPIGFYRWVVAVAGSRAGVGSGKDPITFHIVPPIGDESIVKGTFFQGTGAPPFAAPHLYTAIFPPTVASVKISPGAGNDVVQQASQSDTQVDNVDGMPFPLPEGWRLMAYTDNNANPNPIGLPITLRMAFYELSNGMQPPNVNRQRQ